MAKQRERKYLGEDRCKDGAWTPLIRNEPGSRDRMGVVYLVGAGPGDEELITLKAVKKIEEADVILYDRLINRNLLKYAKSGCKVIYVGKKKGEKKFAQGEINRMLIEFAKQGLIVVRLKCGDPYVFGRGGEEAEALSKAGVRFEVIPGITSGIAAPEYAGIPLTHRKYASIVVFATGHEDPTGRKMTVQWDLLAKINGTIVVFMGVKRLKEIVRKLLENGKKPETPIAVIERGTTEKQKVIVGKLCNIVSLTDKRNVKPPAVIVIGEVVNLRRL